MVPHGAIDMSVVSPVTGLNTPQGPRIECAARQVSSLKAGLICSMSCRSVYNQRERDVWCVCVFGCALHPNADVHVYVCIYIYMCVCVCTLYIMTNGVVLRKLCLSDLKRFSSWHQGWWSQCFMGKNTRNRPCFMGKSAENLKICHEKMGKLIPVGFPWKKWKIHGFQQIFLPIHWWPLDPGSGMAFFVSRSCWSTGKWEPKMAGLGKENMNHKILVGHGKM